MGAPAARKSAAIDVGTGLLRAVKYKFLAPERMSREAFLDEMLSVNNFDLMDAGGIEELLDRVDDLDGGTTEFTIHASEFIDFMGQGDKDYLMLLTTLYDNRPSYTNPKVTRKRVAINKPTINLLGAATPENLNMAFPTNMMDTGTLSRFLFIHSKPVKDKVLIPTGCLDQASEVILKDTLTKIRDLRGVMKLNEGATDLLEGIYHIAEPLKDQRFSYYSGRRLSHLIKLSMIEAASNLRMEITEQDILTANTILCAAEANMTSALGNFGGGKYSQASHNIITYVESRPNTLTMTDIYRVFASEFSKQTEFTAVFTDLVDSNRLVLVKNAAGKTVANAVKATIPQWAADLMVPEVLTKQEREVVGL